MDAADPSNFRETIDINDRLGHRGIQCSSIDLSHNEGDANNAIPRPHTARSDTSIYSAPDPDDRCARSERGSSISSKSSNDSIAVTIVERAGPRPPTLRHRACPRGVSLRELSVRQARQLRTRRQLSEEELRRCYESQIASYLEWPTCLLGELVDRGVEPPDVRT